MALKLVNRDGSVVNIKKYKSYEVDNIGTVIVNKYGEDTYYYAVKYIEEYEISNGRKVVLFKRNINTDDKAVERRRRRYKSILENDLPLIINNVTESESLSSLLEDALKIFNVIR